MTPAYFFSGSGINSVTRDVNIFPEKLYPGTINSGLKMYVRKTKAVAISSKDSCSFPTEHTCLGGCSAEILKSKKKHLE